MDGGVCEYRSGILSVWHIYCQFLPRQAEIPKRRAKISNDISARLFRVTRVTKTQVYLYAKIEL